MRRCRRRHRSAGTDSQGGTSASVRRDVGETRTRRSRTASAEDPGCGPDASTERDRDQSDLKRLRAVVKRSGAPRDCAAGGDRERRGNLSLGPVAPGADCREEAAIHAGDRARIEPVPRLRAHPDAQVRSGSARPHARPRGPDHADPRTSGIRPCADAQGVGGPRSARSPFRDGMPSVTCSIHGL